MGAWPALAHSHRLPNQANALFGIGDGPAMNGRMRRRAQDGNLQAAPVQNPAPPADIQMEVDEPANANNDSDSETNNTDDEEIQR